MPVKRIAFVAPIIRAAMARLQDDLATAIANFNGEAANTVDLTLPTEIIFGAKAIHAAGYPYIEVAALSGQIGTFAIGEADQASEADSDPRVQVIVWVEGSSGEVPELYEAALGYARVVIEILSQDDAFGSENEIANEPDAITWRVDPVIGEIDEETREVRRWKLPASVSFAVETVERWT